MSEFPAETDPFQCFGVHGPQLKTRRRNGSSFQASIRTDKKNFVRRPSAEFFSHRDRGKQMASRSAAGEKNSHRRFRRRP